MLGCSSLTLLVYVYYLPPVTNPQCFIPFTPELIQYPIHEMTFIIINVHDTALVADSEQRLGQLVGEFGKVCKQRQ